jgi:quercetin dioxygenase-like cupin family protein
MEIYKLNDFKRGWVIGNFEPSLFKGNFEVGIHSYPSGTEHMPHYHKESSEINVVTSGSCIFKLFNANVATHVLLTKGDIVVVNPNEVVGFYADTDCELTVIKTQSVKDDKYLYGN